MERDIYERTLSEAKLMLDENLTIRAIAVRVGMSKSSVHNDLSKRLKIYNENIYGKIKKILEKNFAEKHIRGGFSTKNKYLKLNKKI